jgi:hypothetical protein
MPITTRSVAVKRGDGSTAGGGTATAVGTYLLESFSITRPAKIIDRMGTSGEMVGTPTIIRDPITFTCKAQIDTTTTNMIKAGDYFEESIDIDAGAASANKVRFVIGPVTKDESAGTPFSFNLSGQEDMPHSTQYGGS